MNRWKGIFIALIFVVSGAKRYFSTAIFKRKDKKHIKYFYITEFSPWKKNPFLLTPARISLTRRVVWNKRNFNRTAAISINIKIKHPLSITPRSRVGNNARSHLCVLQKISRAYCCQMWALLHTIWRICVYG